MAEIFQIAFCVLEAGYSSSMLVSTYNTTQYQHQEEFVYAA